MLTLVEQEVETKFGDLKTRRAAYLELVRLVTLVNGHYASLAKLHNQLYTHTGTVLDFRRQRASSAFACDLAAR